LVGRITPNRITQSDQVQWWETELLRLLREAALELVHTGDQWPQVLLAVSPVRLVSKTGPKKFRAVINMRAVNSYLPQRHFKMETFGNILRGIGRGWYLVTWDLAPGYHQILISDQGSRFLGIKWKNQWFRFKVLPFGMSTSPWVFTKIMKEVVKHWRQMGIFVWVYLDDFILAAPTQAIALQWRNVVEADMNRLGLAREPTKGQWEPTQRVQVLGLIIDTAKGTVEVPESKVAQVSQLAQHLTSVPVNAPIQARHLASVAGKVVALSRAFAPARLLTRSFYRLIDSTHRAKWEWSDPVLMTEAIRMDAKRLLSMLQVFNGRSAWWPARVEVLYSDASTTGWGAVWRGNRTSGLWTPQERSCHINLLEIRAVAKALQAFSTQLSGRQVHLRVDNQVARAYLGAQGGHILLLSTEAESVWLLAIRLGIDIVHTSWIAGAMNPADEPSRWEADDWMISRHVFRTLDQMWGPHTCDRFASNMNHQTLCYNDRQMNTFTQDWEHHVNWLVPPFRLIGNALRMVAQSRSRATIIIPWWPAQTWWPLLMSMALQYVPLAPEAIVLGPSAMAEPTGQQMAAVRLNGMLVPTGL
jgi:ribonuclease HI